MQNKRKKKGKSEKKCQSLRLYQIRASFFPFILFFIIIFATNYITITAKDETNRISTYPKHHPAYRRGLRGGKALCQATATSGRHSLPGGLDISNLR
jgi:hypothetical protein